MKSRRTSFCQSGDDREVRKSSSTDHPALLTKGGPPGERPDHPVTILYTGAFPMETARPRARTGNLTAALVAVALLELSLNRLAGRLFFPRATLSLGGGSHAAATLAACGPFLFQLTAVLALSILVASFSGLLRRGELYPRAMRFLVIVIALVFAALSGQAILRG